MGRVKADRGQQWADGLLEVCLHPCLLRFVAVLMPQQVNAVVGQLRQDFIVQYFILPLDDGMALHACAVHRIRQAGRQGRVSAHPVLRQQAGQPHLEELIQVAADDAQETQAFQQGNILVLCLRQHAPVECELRQFPVQIDAGRFAA
jgi:hypothetical protein